MKKQDYQNHRMYYAPHHFIFLPVMGFLFVTGIIKVLNDPARRLEWILFSVLCLSILYLAIMLRQHYALGNQNRIVRLEFRLRYFQLFGTNSESVEKKLSFGQIAALRFAGDAEFEQLLKKTMEENLSGNEIKKLIRNWQPDNMRV